MPRGELQPVMIITLSCARGEVLGGAMVGMRGMVSKAPGLERGTESSRERDWGFALRTPVMVAVVCFDGLRG